MGIYLHIPFCRRKCSYCDFNSYVTDESIRAAYVDALATEICWWGRALAGAADEARTTGAARSVYVGGGTPSLLTPNQLRVLLRGCEEALGITAGAEVTIEANPESASLAWLQDVRSLGYNRLSLGVQSFDDSLLKVLGRLHTAGDALRCYHDARQAGFENISLDLMFGLDGQSLDLWRRSLETAIQLGPEHISLYGLTVEEGTALAGQVRKGTYVTADPEFAAEMYGLAEEMLADAGYEHYELSNWARPGRQSWHNLNYWTSGPYLGCGAGAHARLGKYRFWAVSRPRAYIAAWVPGSAGVSPARPLVHARAGRPRSRENHRLSVNPLGLPEAALDGWEELTPSACVQESIMLGLRLGRGIVAAEFQRETGCRLEELVGPTLLELREVGLLDMADGAIRATRRGRLLLDEILARLFAGLEG